MMKCDKKKKKPHLDQLKIPGPNHTILCSPGRCPQNRCGYSISRVYLAASVSSWNSLSVWKARTIWICDGWVTKTRKLFQSSSSLDGAYRKCSNHRAQVCIKQSLTSQGTRMWAAGTESSCFRLKRNLLKQCQRCSQSCWEAEKIYSPNEWGCPDREEHAATSAWWGQHCWTLVLWTLAAAATTRSASSCLCFFRSGVLNSKSSWSRDFPGGPVVMTLPSNAGVVGLVPGWGAKIPQALHAKSQNINQKQYCNKFNKNFKNGPH